MIRALRPLSLALTAVCLVLAVVVVQQRGPAQSAQAAASVSSAVAVAGLAAAPAAGAPPRFAAPPLANFSAMVDRPLFAPTRRPPLQAPDAEGVAAPPSLALELVGIVVAGDRRLAAVLEQNQPEVRLVGEGETVGGWRVEAIHQRHVEISLDGGSRELTLREDGKRLAKPKGRIPRR